MFIEGVANRFNHTGVMNFFFLGYASVAPEFTKNKEIIVPKKLFPQFVLYTWLPTPEGIVRTRVKLPQAEANLEYQELHPKQVNSRSSSQLKYY